MTSGTCRSPIERMSWKNMLTWYILHSNMLSFHVLPVNYVKLLMHSAVCKPLLSKQLSRNLLPMGARSVWYLTSNYSVLVCTSFGAIKIFCVLTLVDAEVPVKLQLEKILNTSKCLIHDLWPNINVPKGFGSSYSYSVRKRLKELLMEYFFPNDQQPWTVHRLREVTATKSDELT